MNLFHFAPLLYLPDILREGLTPVELLMPGSKPAVPLTTNPNPNAQYWARGSVCNKVKVRLSVAIPENDPKLQAWRKFCKSRPSDKRLARKTDPTGQGKFWWIYPDRVPPEWITGVEILDDDGYHECSKDELDLRVAAIVEEKAKIKLSTIYLPEIGLKTRAVRLGDTRKSWLFDAVAPSISIAKKPDEPSDELEDRPSMLIDDPAAWLQSVGPHAPPVTDLIKNPALLRLLKAADLVWGYDTTRQTLSMFYGKERMDDISRGQADEFGPSQMIVFSLDFATDELEQFIAIVEELKGSCCYNM